MKLPRELIMALVRHGLSAAGLLLVHNGVLDRASQDGFVNLLEAAIGVAIGVWGLGWSFKRKIDRQSGKEIRKATPAPRGNPAKR